MTIELLVSYKTVEGGYFDKGHRYQCLSANETHFELIHRTTRERVAFARSEGRVIETPKSNVRFAA
jgi:hypothetical protein